MFAFEPLHERQQGPIADPQDPLQRRQRGGLPGRGLAKQVFECVLGRLSRVPGPTAAPPGDHADTWRKHGDPGEQEKRDPDGNRHGLATVFDYTKLKHIGSQNVKARLDQFC
jgi:hypothetical protein